jgi:cytochrome c-type biogenesis protein CcmH
MMAFAVVAAIFVVVALGWLLPVLMRRSATPGVDAAASNLALLRDGVVELERDLANAVVSREQYEQSRRELERRALEETSTAPPAAAHIGHGTKAALVLAVALPIVSALLYLQLGTPGAITHTSTSTPNGTAQGQPTQQEVEAMVTQLAVKLKADPNDAQGWALLARSYFVLDRFHEAAGAYARAAALIKDDADLLADYADALAMDQGRRIDDKVLAIVEQALKLDPTHWKALAIAGSGAFERKDYAGAIRYWEMLRQRAAPGSEFAQMLEANITEAHGLMGAGGPPKMAERSGSARTAEAPAPPRVPAPEAPSAAGAGSRVSGTVTLSPALAARVSPSDTLFVFARAAEGPRQPLAILRHQVKDLPLKFNLDDTHAMAPQLKLSNFSDVIVSARVSKSGQALPQSGDLQGATGKVKVGASDVRVAIDSVVP